MFWTLFSMVSFRTDSTQYLNQSVLFKCFQLLIGVKLLQVLRNRRYIPNAGKFCIHTAFITEKGKTPWRRLTLVLTFLLIRWYSWLLSHYYLAPFPCNYVALFLYLLSFSDPYYYLVQFPLLLHCSNPICSFLDFSNLQFV